MTNDKAQKKLVGISMTDGEITRLDALVARLSRPSRADLIRLALDRVARDVAKGRGISLPAREPGVELISEPTI